MMQLNKQTITPAALGFPVIQPLTNDEKAETVNFLSRRPQQTFLMSGWIHDNGMESSLNRGSFYGSRNVRGQLDGVALIGHVTLFETGTQAALEAFAALAHSCPGSHTLVGEQNQVKQFLRYYHSSERPASRMRCRELMFEQ